MANYCPICNKKTSFWGAEASRFACLEGKLCSKCAKEKISPQLELTYLEEAKIRHLHIGEALSFIQDKLQNQENSQRMELLSRLSALLQAEASRKKILRGFSATFTPHKKISFDDNHKLLLANNNIVLDYSQIRYCDIILVDSEQITNSNGVGRAVVGGILAGGTGAVVGATTAEKRMVDIIKRLYIKLTISSLSKPAIFIDLVSSPIDKNSAQARQLLQTAEIVASKVHLIIDEHLVPPNAEKPFDAVKEIRRYKELLDDGIISQEEFELKKKELLFNGGENK